MDEREAIRRVKNSLRAGKSRGEILEGFAKKGYRIGYGEKLIEKAKRPRRILFVVGLSVLILVLIVVASYFPFFCLTEKKSIENPMSTNGMSGYMIRDENGGSDFEITPEFITFLLNEAGAWQLRKNPLTLEPPIINFKIGQEEFYSKIGKDIETFRGSDKNADIEFRTKKEVVQKALESENPKGVFVEEVLKGDIRYELKAGDLELLAKGYLNFYNSLK